MKSPPPVNNDPCPQRLARVAGQPSSLPRIACRSLRAGVRPRGRILLVNRHVTFRDSICDLLVAEGYFVVPAENRQQALDLAGRLRVELVLLDLDMPLERGWETFAELTREHPILPIMIMTEHPNQVFTAASAGAGALLQKPMDIPTLLLGIQRLLAESIQERLQRLAGRSTQFYYRPATQGQGRCE